MKNSKTLLWEHLSICNSLIVGALKVGVVPTHFFVTSDRDMASVYNSGCPKGSVIQTTAPLKSKLPLSLETGLKRNERSLDFSRVHVPCNQTVSLSKWCITFMPASWYKQCAWNTYRILLYSSLSTFSSMSTFNVSIPGAFRQRYFPSSKCGTTKANFGSLRWETKTSSASKRTQRL